MHTQTAAMFTITDDYVCLLFFLIECSYVQYSTDGSQSIKDRAKRQMDT
jgi:hypothetical protein